MSWGQVSDARRRMSRACGRGCARGHAHRPAPVDVAAALLVAVAGAGIVAAFVLLAVGADARVAAARVQGEAARGAEALPLMLEPAACALRAAAGAGAALGMRLGMWGPLGALVLVRCSPVRACAALEVIGRAAGAGARAARDRGRVHGRPVQHDGAHGVGGAAHGGVRAAGCHDRGVSYTAANVGCQLHRGLQRIPGARAHGAAAPLRGWDCVRCACMAVALVRGAPLWHACVRARPAVTAPLVAAPAIIIPCWRWCVRCAHFTPRTHRPQFQNAHAPPYLAAGEVALASRGVALSAPYTRARGASFYALIAPVARPGDAPHALLVVTIDAAAAAAEMELPPAYATRLADVTEPAAVVIFAAGGDPAVSSDVPAAAVSYTFLNRTWSLIVAPAPALLSVALGTGQATVVAAGVPLVMLAGARRSGAFIRAVSAPPPACDTRRFTALGTLVFAACARRVQAQAGATLAAAAARTTHDRIMGYVRGTGSDGRPRFLWFYARGVCVLHRRCVTGCGTRCTRRSGCSTSCGAAATARRRTFRRSCAAAALLTRARSRPSCGRCRYFLYFFAAGSHGCVARARRRCSTP
jgi:hypothetical protein